MTRSRTIADLYDDEILEVLVAMLEIASRLTAHGAARRPCEAATLTEIGTRCNALHDAILAHWAAQVTPAAALDDEPDVVDAPVFEGTDELIDDTGIYRRP
jgi:hypothetical protein